MYPLIHHHCYIFLFIFLKTSTNLFITSLVQMIWRDEQHYFAIKIQFFFSLTLLFRIRHCCMEIPYTQPHVPLAFASNNNSGLCKHLIVNEIYMWHYHYYSLTLFFFTTFTILLLFLYFTNAFYWINCRHIFCQTHSGYVPLNL